MGSCRIYGKERELRDVNGNVPRSITLSNNAMDKWRKKLKLLKREDT